MAAHDSQSMRIGNDQQFFDIIVEHTLVEQCRNARRVAAFVQIADLGAGAAAVGGFDLGAHSIDEVNYRGVAIVAEQDKPFAVCDGYMRAMGQLHKNLLGNNAARTGELPKRDAREEDWVAHDAARRGAQAVSAASLSPRHMRSACRFSAMS